MLIGACIPILHPTLRPICVFRNLRCSGTPSCCAGCGPDEYEVVPCHVQGTALNAVCAGCANQVCNTDQYRTHLRAHPLTHIRTHSLTHPLTPPSRTALTHPLTHSFSRSVSHTPPPPPSLTHPLTHSSGLQHRSVSHRLLRRRHQRLFLPRLLQPAVPHRHGPERDVCGRRQRAAVHAVCECNVRDRHVQVWQLRRPRRWVQLHPVLDMPGGVRQTLT